MKSSYCLTICTIFLAVSVAITAVHAVDTETSVKGEWSVNGSQENHIGTSEYHKYHYSYKYRWDYVDGVFYQNNVDYSNTIVSGNTLTAEYDKFGERVSIRIEFIDENTASYTREGHNDAFGDFKVNATATRIK